MVLLSCLFGCVALVTGTAEASTVMATGGGCNGAFAYTASASVASLGKGGGGSAAAAAQEAESANSCQDATGSCEGSPCNSVTCTFTMNDGAVRTESYTATPPISNSACASTFCKSKCE
jgi:hypothetical protein